MNEDLDMETRRSNFRNLFMSHNGKKIKTTKINNINCNIQIGHEIEDGNTD